MLTNAYISTKEIDNKIIIGKTLTIMELMADPGAGVLLIVGSEVEPELEEDVESEAGEDDGVVVPFDELMK